MTQTTSFDKFVPPHSSILIRRAEPVEVEEIESSETRGHIEEMLRVAYGEQRDESKPILIGLAAPQIGIAKRIILVDLLADGTLLKRGNLQAYINPEITWCSIDENEWYEGCFSTSHVCGIVSRPTRIRLEAFKPSGELIRAEHSGYTARIFQHEIDHLDGRVFVSRIIDDDKIHWVEKEEIPKYRKNYAWRNWPYKCSRERWEKIKNGSNE